MTCKCSVNYNKAAQGVSLKLGLMNDAKENNAGDAVAYIHIVYVSMQPRVFVENFCLHAFLCHYYRQELRLKRAECERFLKDNESSLVPVHSASNDINKVAGLISNDQKGMSHVTIIFFLHHVKIL